MRLVQFGSVLLPELNGSDSGVGSQARNNIIKLQDGAYDLDGNEIFLEPMSISRNAVSNDTDLDATMQALFSEGKRGRLVLKAKLRDGSYVQTYAKMLGQQRQIQAGDYECLQAYNMQWMANYPYWLDSDHEPIHLDHGYTLDSGLFLDGANSQTATPITVASPTTTVTINNQSGFDIYRVAFVITKTGASTLTTGTPIIIYNATSNYKIEYNRFMSDITSPVNTRVDIDCLAKTVQSSVETNDFNQLVATGESNDWMVLKQGNNDIDFSFNGGSGLGSLTLRVVWSTHYL